MKLNLADVMKLALNHFSYESDTQVDDKPTKSFKRESTTTIRPFHGQIPRPSMIVTDRSPDGLIVGPKWNLIEKKTNV